ncbi:MAG: hypothetical protein E7662_02310 [Ruminococcaceae bacterium]|nr:hypothetical protein [Oscillospiraceae bacterium]
MKKKILALALCAVMLAVAAVGGTLAYFTDTDAQTNVFTYGNVKIDLFEDFNSENINIVPAVFTPFDPDNPETNTWYGTFVNKIEKEVYVENEGSEEAYVRVHIAVPKLAEVANAAPDLDQNKKLPDGAEVLNLTCDEDTTIDTKWNWGKTAETTYAEARKDFNSYEVKIGEIDYTVYVVTYETKMTGSVLGSNNYVTCDAINGVYMHSKVTNEMISHLDKTYKDEFGSPNWARIYVVAEAAQADGFNTQVQINGKVGDISEIPDAEVDGTAAFRALNTSFGNPANGYKLTKDDFLAQPEGEETRDLGAVNEDIDKKNPMT